MRSLKELALKGKRAVVRVDFNVPLDAGYNITSDKRMVAALPTLKYILDAGGSLVLMSHLGRPKEGPTEEFSLLHLVNHLSSLLGRSVIFGPDCMKAQDQAHNLKPGEVLLLENLRFYKEETKGDEGFAKTLASYGDVYVNDAFGAAHRAHASTTIMAQYFGKEHRCFGFLMEAELENAQKVLNGAARPFTAIMGGAKVSDKILLIKNLLDKVDNLIIGGGMAYTFARAKGGATGNSLVEEDKLELAAELMDLAQEKGVNLVLPTDSVIADKFAADARTDQASNDTIPEGWMGLDIGPESIEQAVEVLERSKTILWNGPMGVFEMDAFATGTRKVGEAVVQATSKGAFSLIGGGDSASAVKKFGLTKGVSYVSTGGGALLELLEGKQLPGVAAILN